MTNFDRKVILTLRILMAWRSTRCSGVASRNFIIYHATTPELEKWWDAEESKFRKTKEIYNALGRRFKVIQRIT